MALRSSGLGWTAVATALWLALSPSPANAAGIEASHRVYSLVADPAGQARLEPSLRRLARTGLRPASGETAMAYASCVTAWRDNAGESAACVQSWLARLPPPRPVLLHVQQAQSPAEGVVVDCLGAAGSDQLVLAPRPRRADAAALDACMARAQRGDAPPAGTYAIRSPETWDPADAAALRARAAAVLVLAVDHVGIPRGVRGSCLVEGRVTSVVRGAGLSPRGRVELAIPCQVGQAPGKERRIDMAEFDAGSFARLYLDEAQTLLDYESLDP